MRPKLKCKCGGPNCCIQVCLSGTLEADLAYSCKTKKQRSTNKMLEFDDVIKLQHEGAAALQKLVDTCKAMRLALNNQQKGPSCPPPSPPKQHEGEHLVEHVPSWWLKLLAPSFNTKQHDIIQEEQVNHTKRSVSVTRLQAIRQLINHFGFMQRMQFRDRSMNDWYSDVRPLTLKSNASWAPPPKQGNVNSIQSW